jgi:hypothetical protein
MPAREEVQHSVLELTSALQAFMLLLSGRKRQGEALNMIF